MSIITSFVVGIIFSSIFAIIGVWLWNYAMVSMFGVPEITFWKMFALMVLVRLIVPSRVNYNKNNK